MAKWVCSVCGYVYDEDVAPEKDRCPDCGRAYALNWSLRHWAEERGLGDVYAQYAKDLEQIEEECEAEGYPAHGSNFELRAEELRKSYPELFPEYDEDEDESEDSPLPFPEAKNLATHIAEANEWNPDHCRRLCELAGMSAELEAADGESFETVVYAAAEKLGVEI